MSSNVEGENVEQDREELFLFKRERVCKWEARAEVEEEREEVLKEVPCPEPNTGLGLTS